MISFILHHTYVTNIFAPGKKSSLVVLAVTLGGVGGLTGKYIHATMYRMAIIASSEETKKK